MAEAQIARLDAVHEARVAEAKRRRDKAMEFIDPTENANVFWQVGLGFKWRECGGGMRRWTMCCIV